MQTTCRFFLLVGTSCHLFLLGTAKVCKVEEEVIKLVENYPFSGEFVRHVTTEIKRQICTEDLPNCCGNDGCCDERGWKIFVVVFVGSVAGMLFLSFLSVFCYSALCHRKKHKGEEPVRAEPRTVQPRYNMDTYLTVAGLDPDFMRHGPPRPVVLGLEHHAADSSESSSEEE